MIFAVTDVDLQAVAFECFGNVEARQVVRWMTGDGDIVVVNQQLDIQILSNGQSSGFCVVAFHLRSVRSQHEHDFVRVGDRHTVDVWPHVTESTRAELNTGREAFFGVSRQMRQIFAVVEQSFDIHIAFQHCHQVLSGNAVASFVKEDGQVHLVFRPDEHAQ